jgi:DAACS family dicarboxylate/amino acid:cation (Na+ or H+) symporter
MVALVADLGTEVLGILLRFVLTSLAGLALHMFGVYSLVLAVLAGLNPLRFFSRISEVILTAFGTSSSNATLPTALRVAWERLGLRREISNFVLTVGATANQNGTALYEGVTVLFLAQVFGVPLSLSDQLFVALMCVLGGIGTAGVPGGSLPYIALILQSVGVPAEGIGVIAGIDRLLDMCRTTVNVTGDLAIAACVDRWSRAAPPPTTAA